ncbi:hypothetical protein BX600DRAFT_478111 [Xylariales sp. PMI_506]|nr:hypothetical protein BX600DRAFT_478111 [Xylariales sp. PMI_506]
MTENGGAPLPHGPAVRHPVAVFFDQFVGRDLVRQLRRLELDAEDSSNNIPGLIPDDDDRRVRDFVHVMRKASSMLNLRHLKIENLSAPAATASWDELAAMSAETLVEFVRGVIAKLVWPALSDWPSRGQAGTASGDMTGVRRTVDGMGSVDRFIVKMTFGYSIVIRYYRGVADSDALAGQWWEGAEMSASINLGGSGNLQGDVDGGWVEQVLLNQIT